PSFANAPLDLAERQVVWPATEVFAELAFGERTKPTAKVAYVGVVDVAIDDVAHPLAVDRRPERVGRGAYSCEFLVARAEQSCHLGLGQGFAGARLVDDRAESAIQHAQFRGRDERAG